MSVIETGGIDCDNHPAVPNLKALHPFLSDHGRDIIVQQGLHELNSVVCQRPGHFTTYQIRTNQ